jgi:NADH-quinone oxidoreductase subunit H
VAVLLHSGTLSTRGIVNGQMWTSWDSFVTSWYWAPAIVSFVIFVIAAIAETNHPPFDLVEAEQELVGGFNTEYTGIRFAIFFLAEFMNVITMSAIAVTLFLGGPSGPALGFLPKEGTVNVWIMPVFWFLLKLVILLYGTVWVRASLPRLRYDQLMDLGWKGLIELAFLWVMVSGVIIVGREESWDSLVVVPAAILGALAVLGFLRLCMPKRGELRDEVF